METLKILGINSAVMGVVTLTEIEVLLKIALLVVTITWTTGKAVEQWRKLKD